MHSRDKRQPFYQASCRSNMLACYVSPGAPPETCPFNDTAPVRQEDAQFVRSANLTIMPIIPGSDVDKHTRRTDAVASYVPTSPRCDLFSNLTSMEENCKGVSRKFPEPRVLL